MARSVHYGHQAREELLEGVNKVADAVKITIGPEGRNVLIEKRNGEPPLITNDGAAIAGEIQLKNAFGNMGAQVLREAALKVNGKVGDGTTTTILLAQEIFSEGMKNLAAGADPIALRRGIIGAAGLAVRTFREKAVKITARQEIAQVASLSAQDEEIGGMIADALERVGEEGVVHIEESGGLETVLEITEGIVLDKGYLSPYMAGDPLGQELEEPYILVTDYKLNNIQELIPVLELAAGEGRPLLIIAEELGDHVLTMLIRNKLEGDLEIIAIHPPAYGEGRRWKMDDLAVQTGGVFITGELGYSLKEITPDMLGTAKRAVVKKDSTMIFGGGGDPQRVKERENQIRSLIQATDYDFNRERFEERLASFVSGIASIKIGAYTEAELKEKKARAEDALHAARAAVDAGVVPGGGAIFLHGISVVEAYAKTLAGDERTGAKIVEKALERPTAQIVENAGLDSSAVVERLKKEAFPTGFDAVKGIYPDMLAAGIMDPVQVSCLALECAASAAATLLTMEAGVVEEGTPDAAP